MLITTYLLGLVFSVRACVCDCVIYLYIYVIIPYIRRKINTYIYIYINIWRYVYAHPHTHTHTCIDVYMKGIFFLFNTYLLLEANLVVLSWWLLKNTSMLLRHVYNYWNYTIWFHTSRTRNQGMVPREMERREKRFIDLKHELKTIHPNTTLYRQNNTCSMMYMLQRDSIVMGMLLP